MMSKGNTLVHFKFMLLILIVIISNILSALWVHSCLHIHHIVMLQAPQNISASSAYDSIKVLVEAVTETHCNEWPVTYTLKPENNHYIIKNQQFVKVATYITRNATFVYMYMS